MKYTVAKFLLVHRDAIKADLAARLTCDDPVFSKLINEAAIEEVIRYVATELKLPYDQVAEVITEEFLLQLFGVDFFQWRNA